MKRYIRSTTFMDVLENPKYSRLVDKIEELQSDIQAKGIDVDDDSEFLVRAYKNAIDELEEASGYRWR